LLLRGGRPWTRGAVPEVADIAIAAGRIAGLGRDLTFHLLDGMIGAPTVLATGLEMRRGA